MHALVLATLLALPGGPALEIDFWYGPDQVFGALGRSQAQINILGNVASETGLQQLTYRLDGGPELPLSFGPDGRRLVSPGDFNIELFLDELTPGEHTVLVRAVDDKGQIATNSLDFRLMPEQVWPLPFNARWMNVNEVPDAAQPVDGHWLLVPGGIRCVTPGYDRLVAIGDMQWTDYEVRVPITIHSVDPNGYLPPSNTPGIGLVFRWNGHTDFLKPGSQPSVGYWPIGGAGEYVYHLDQCGARLQLYGNPFVLQDQDDSCQELLFDVTYIWKMRVRTRPSDGKHIYKFKVWRQGTPEPAWLLSMVEEASQPAHGSLLLLAHHVDATFGPVRIKPLINAQATVEQLVRIMQTESEASSPN